MHKSQRVKSASPRVANAPRRAVSTTHARKINTSSLKTSNKPRSKVSTTQISYSNSNIDANTSQSRRLTTSTAHRNIINKNLAAAASAHKSSLKTASLSSVFSISSRSLFFSPADLPNHAKPTIQEIKKKNIDKFNLPHQQQLTSQQFIERVPVIYLDTDVAICDGDVNTFSGHPREFIQLNKSRVGEPETCKYCGLRYAQKVAQQVQEH